MRAFFVSCLCLGVVACDPETSGGGGNQMAADAAGEPQTDASGLDGSARTDGAVRADGGPEADAAPTIEDAATDDQGAGPVPEDAAPSPMDARPLVVDAAAVTVDAAPLVEDAASLPDGPPPGLRGQVPRSCGGGPDGFGPVDCTAEGDLDASCVFGDHCMCSPGFVCEVQTQFPNSPECDPGSICVVDEVDRSQASSCGAGGPGGAAVDCTRGGDLEAVCVFSDHCMCSAGFRCESDPAPDDDFAECDLGSSCVPVD